MSKQDNATIDQELKVTKTDILKVPYELTEIIEGMNIRTDYGDMAELVESIRNNGIKVPLRGYVKGGRYFIVAGHRRHRAVGILKEQGVNVLLPFIPDKTSVSAEQQIIDTFLTNDGEPLKPLEQAEGIRRLISYEWTEKQIAERLGKSISYVNRLHKLIQAPKKFQNLVNKGELTAAVAIKIMEDKKGGGIDAFMERYEAGEFTAPDPMDGLGSPNGKESSKKRATITAGRVAAPSSAKLFKMYAEEVALSDIQEDRIGVFKFLQQFITNDLNEKDFKAFFEKGKDIKKGHNHE